MKNISDFGWLMIMFMVVMISLSIASIFEGSGYKNQLGGKECQTYSMAQRSNVPVGCYEYFGIK